MRFILDDEQRLFGETLDKLLASADIPAVTRAWASGSHDPGLALWRSLARTGLFGLAVPEPFGGAGMLPVELVTAFRALGGHGVPGPYAETVAAAELLAGLGDPPAAPAPAASQWLPMIASGDAVVSLALPPEVPLALDADAADLVLVANGADLRRGTPGAPRQSIDPARRLFTLSPGDLVSPGHASASGVLGAAEAAYDLGVLLCAAQLSGLGDRLLSVTVDYAKTRQQFGRPIGEFQAVKHHLADTYVALEHARPLLYGAALSHRTPDFPRDVSAAKAAASDAAYLTARIALQVHGAIGYTDEYAPTLLIRKARALHTAWGSPSAHRSRVLDSLTAGSLPRWLIRSRL